jgi:hypothetical protein
MFGHEFEVRFNLKSDSQIKLLFEGAVKIGDFEIETQEGKIVGKTSISIDIDHPELAKRQAFDKIEELATILTLIFGTACEIYDLRVVHKPIIEKTESEQKISIFFRRIHTAEGVVVIKGTPKEVIEEQYNFWRDKLRKLEDKEVLIRALKWWRRGSLDDDKVDKFIHYFIVLELLASKYSYRNIEKFCSEYGIKYKPDERCSLKDVRNKLIHDISEGKDVAEEWARKFADTLGYEIFQAIKKIIEKTCN